VGERITADELRSLLSEAEGLSFIKGKWLEVNHERLQETLKAYEQVQSLMGNTDFSMVDYSLRIRNSSSHYHSKHSNRIMCTISNPSTSSSE